jgi:integrase
MEALKKFSENHLTRLDLSVIGKMRNGNNEKLTISEKSKEAYLIAGKQFNEYLDETGQGITPQSVKSFLNSKMWGASTFNLKRQALINIIANQKNIPENFIFITAIKEAIKNEVKRVKVNRAITREDYLTKNQIEILKSVARPRIALIIEFLFKSGCRITEMIHIKLTDIELN